MLPKKCNQLLAGTLLLAGDAFAIQPQACMACRRSDMHAGFLTTYSFCNESDECVQDVWNFYNRNCSSGWKRGIDLDIITDCNAVEASCNSYNVTKNSTGVQTNASQTLNVDKYCYIRVDAREGTARVIFDDAKALGVEVDRYQIGDVITIEREIKEILIFNGAEKGAQTFILSFSGAYSALSAAAVGAVAALTLF